MDNSKNWIVSDGYAVGRDSGNIVRILAKIPEGWTRIRNATTAPVGLAWISNNKSYFGKDRETAFVRV